MINPGVASHGGFVELNSGRGLGATFTIVLPASSHLP